METVGIFYGLKENESDDIIENVYELFSSCKCEGWLVLYELRADWLMMLHLLLISRNAIFEDTKIRAVKIPERTNYCLKIYSAHFKLMLLASSFI